MYEALQHFDETDIGSLLRIIKRISSEDMIICFSSVPDINHIWSFYNTPERRKEYYRRKSEGKEAIGTWWSRSVIESAAVSEGFICTFIDQHPSLHTSHYRFDVKIFKDKENNSV